MSQSIVIVSVGWGAVWGKWVCLHGWLRGSAVFPAVSSISIQSGCICGFVCSSRRGRSRAVGWGWDVAIWEPSYRRLTFVQSPRGVLGRRGVPHPPTHQSLTPSSQPQFPLHETGPTSIQSTVGCCHLVRILVMSVCLPPLPAPEQRHRA